MESVINKESITRIIDGLNKQMEILEIKFKEEARKRASYFDLKNIRRQIHEVYEQIRDLENRKNNE